MIGRRESPRTSGGARSERPRMSMGCQRRKWPSLPAGVAVSRAQLRARLRGPQASSPHRPVPASVNRNRIGLPALW